MLKHIQSILHTLLPGIILALALHMPASAQINTTQLMTIGRNAMMFEDYILSIQYFNQVIKVKPYLAEPYYLRAYAKLSLDDMSGAIEDCTLAIERNPFITDAYEIRGIARQTNGDRSGAIEDYNRGLKLMPVSKSFLMNKAIAQIDLKQYAGADSTFSRLLTLYPKFESAYLGRAHLNVAKGDTIAAVKDIERAMQINKRCTNAYLMRAEVRTKYSKRDLQGAIDDLNEAIRLEPRQANYFVNRACIKYNMKDFYGAMADFDYAIDLDPNNFQAHLDRGMMRAEFRDDNKAIEDFNFVLREQPSNMMALYNRAELYQRTRQYRKALADFDAVIAKNPDMPELLYMRSLCKRESGDRTGAERDAKRTQQMIAAMKKKSRTYTAKTFAEAASGSNIEDESQEAVANKFKRLVAVENTSEMKPEYNNRQRGHVQNRNFNIDPEPLFALSYYDKKRDTQSTAYNVRELTDINSTKLLSRVLLLSCANVQLSKEQIEQHFESLRLRTSMIAQNSHRAIDYFARAIDYMMVKNYASAVEDFTRAIELSPQFTLAWYGRGVARYQQYKASEGASATSSPVTAKEDAMMRDKLRRQQLTEINDDFAHVLSLSPKFLYAHYNRGCVFLEMQDYTSAISAFTSALDIKADLGEAYYNRGLVYLRLGNKNNGIADLSKAGEHGITPSYSILKRMK